jgi:hypothetical protein
VRARLFFPSVSRARARAPPQPIIALACLLFVFLGGAIVFRVLCGIFVFCLPIFVLPVLIFSLVFLWFFSFPEIVSCLIFYFLFFWFGLRHEWKGDKEIVGEGETKRRRTTTTTRKEEEEEEEEEGLREGFICTFILEVEKSLWRCGIMKSVAQLLLLFLWLP